MFQVLDSTSIREGRTKITHKNGKTVTEINRGLHSNRLNYCREILYGKCLKKDTEYYCICSCLRKSRMERLFDKGRETLKKEMDVVDFFKEFRTLKA